MKATFQCFVGKRTVTHRANYASQTIFFSAFAKIVFKALKLSYVYLKVIFRLQWTLYVVIHNFSKNCFGVSHVGRTNCKFLTILHCIPTIRKYERL